MELANPVMGLLISKFFNESIFTSKVLLYMVVNWYNERKSKIFFSNFFLSLLVSQYVVSQHLQMRQWKYTLSTQTNKKIYILCHSSTTNLDLCKGLSIKPILHLLSSVLFQHFQSKQMVLFLSQSTNSQSTNKKLIRIKIQRNTSTMRSILS